LVEDPPGRGGTPRTGFVLFLSRLAEQ